MNHLELSFGRVTVALFVMAALCACGGSRATGPVLITVGGVDAGVDVDAVGASDGGVDVTVVVDTGSAASDAVAKTDGGAVLVDAVGGGVADGGVADSAAQDSAISVDTKTGSPCIEYVAGSGTAACATYSDCLEQCATQPCCVASCRAKLGAQALKAADDLAACVIQHCTACKSGDDACLQACSYEHCDSGVIACFCPASLPPAGGTKACGSALTCLADCPEIELCCLAKCSAPLSAPAYSELKKLVACLPKCGCKSGDGKCIEKCVSFDGPCVDVGLTCACPGVSVPGSGTKGCNSALSCVGNCKEGDICCQAACAGSLDSGGWSKLKDLVDCLPKCGCKDGDNACVQKCAGGFGGACFQQGIKCATDN